MYINPQTQLTLYSGIPFDVQHKHVLRFTSQGAQNTYFAGKAVKTYTNFSYVREDRVIKVPEVADNINNCNYCSFLNAGFGNRRFYAFITDIEYVANQVTRLTIEVDFVQTFITEWTAGRCFVEREHVTDDTVGKHTVEEGLDVGEYIVADEHSYRAGSAVGLYVVDETNAGVKNGVYNAVLMSGGTGDAGNITDFLAMINAAGNTERVAMLTMVSGNMYRGGSLEAYSTTFTFTRDLNGFSFKGDSYKPVNNKLYCFPYCFITVDNYNGVSESLQWENFDNSNTSATFRVNETPTPKPCMECYPMNYKGSGQAENMGVQYDNFPMCTYAIDTFRAWVSQNVPQAIAGIGATIAVTAVSGGASALAASLSATGLTAATETAIMASAVGGGISAASQAFGLKTDIQNKKVHSVGLGGTVANAGMNFGQNRIGFRVQYHTIKPEYARIIDDFFTRFGYKVERYKVPNLTGRTDFNYVKCVDSVCNGNVPQECIEQVEGMLNNGVTIHHKDF